MNNSDGTLSLNIDKTYHDFPRIQKYKKDQLEYGVESNANTSSYVADIVYKQKYPNIIKQFQSLLIKLLQLFYF